MYNINKIIGWVISPLGILFLGLAFGMLLRFVVRWEWVRRVSNWIIGLTLVFTWLMGCGFVTRWIGVPLETDYVQAGVMHGDITAVPPADLIVVLGGGMGEHRDCGAPEMSSGADRVWQGARLFKAAKAPKLVLTGGGTVKGATALLVDFGVPEEAITTFPTARNTAEEAQLIAATGIKKIILVTSAWHMNRSKLLFERAGLEVLPAPTDFEFHYIQEEPFRMGDFFPSADALQRNSYALKEWVAIVGYRLLK